MQSKEAQSGAGTSAQASAPWWRRPTFAIALGTLLGLIIAVLIFGASHRPCWATYRAPRLAQDVCLADEDAIARGSGDAQRVLQTLTRGWEQGDRRAHIPVEAARAAVLAGDVPRACEWLERALETTVPDRRIFDAPPFSQVKDAHCFTAFLTAHAKQVAAREAGLTRTTPEEAGLNPIELARLVARAKGTRSSALVIVRHGAIAYEWYADDGDTRAELASATQAIAGLAIGALVDDARIASADAPLSVFFPEWRQGEKSKATLRHVLSHSTGLAARSDTSDFISRDDFVRHAIQSPLEAEPGAAFSYNPKAPNLLPGVVLKVAGVPLDAFLDERLFTPLGIRDWDWLRDPAGNPHGMSGLRIHPVELSKIGVMLAQDGRWGERQVLSADWVRQALHQGAPSSRTLGYLFTLHPHRNHRTLDPAGLAKLRSAGLPAETLKALQTLLHRPLEERDFIDELLRIGGSDLYVLLRDRDLLPPLQTSADDVGASALGDGGIHLTVLPSEGLVAVRTAKTGGAASDAEFPDFVNRVRALLPALAPESVAAPAP